MLTRIYCTFFLIQAYSCVIHAQERIPVEDAPYPVSMIKLFSNPDIYHGKKVRIEGFLHYRFEDSSLFFSKTDSDYMIMSNAIWINYNLKAKTNLDFYDEKYVRVIGIFNKDEFGHMGSFAGTLENVEAIYILDKAKREKK